MKKTPHKRTEREVGTKGLNGDFDRRALSALVKSGALINSSLHISEVLDFAMKTAEEFMEAEASSVYELDSEGGMISVRLARGAKGEFIQKKNLALDEGIAGCVMQKGKPMIVKDVQKEHRFSDRFDKETGFETRSLICVPLTIKERTIGALQVINKKGGRPFTGEDLELLTALAHQIAVALDNAQLYERLNGNLKLTAKELAITQKKLIRSERVAAVANLVQGVAHEVRNPIMSIGGFAARIKAGLAKDHKFQKYLDIILIETSKLEKLVRDVKELAEMHSACRRPVDMNNLLTGVIEDFSQVMSGGSIRLDADIEMSLPAIPVDRAQISRALKNILQNSVEAMPQGGIIRLKAYTVDSLIKIIVEDSGIGIDEDILDSAHDPFVTSKATGVGLGLTMVYQIVMNHEGEISINNRGDKGTIVTLDLPLNLQF